MRYLVILGMVVTLAGCGTFSNLKKSEPAPTPVLQAPVAEKEVKADEPGTVNITIKGNVPEKRDKLAEEVKNLEKLYGHPTQKIRAHVDKEGNVTILKDLYFEVDHGTYVVVVTVNGQPEDILTVVE